MAGDAGFLTKDQGRLLNVAAWARYLAWVVLLVFVAGAIAGFAGQMSIVNMQFVQFGQRQLGFFDFLSQYPALGIRLLLDVLRTAFQGVVFFLVLKGVSLALSMVAETDINYRSKAGGAQ